METELKLRLNPADRARISASPLVRTRARGPAVRRRLVNMYYDTPDREGLRHRCMIRLRRQGSTWLQCIKGQGTQQGGLHQRLEFEMPVPGPELDFSLFPDKPALKMFRDPALQARLEPVFETNFWRTTWELEIPGQGMAECCVDHGVIVAGSREEPICEVELELKEGRPALLYDLAGELTQHLHLHLYNVSKAERGYRLLTPVEPAPVRAAPFSWKRSMRTEDVFETILWNALEQIQANEEGILLAHDPEALHQMRIGRRRFQAALSTFGKLFPKSATAPVREGLRAIGAFTGPARDWDVLIDQHLEIMLETGEAEHPLHPLIDRARQQRDRTHTALNRALQDPAYSRHLLQLASWIAHRAWREAMSPAERKRFRKPIVDTAADLLSRQHRRLLRHGGRRLDPLEEHALHDLRIEVKKQRYTVEFFRDLYRDKQVRAYLGILRELQDHLGGLNDYVVARDLLRKRPGQADLPATDPALCYVEGWYTRDRLVRHQQLAPAWSAFRDSRKFWKKS